LPGSLGYSIETEYSNLGETSMKKKPHATLQKKDANPDPQISKDELSDSELNKVTGGGGRDPTSPKIGEITITKDKDVATPILL
jgi:bacteriocin-like protein